MRDTMFNEAHDWHGHHHRTRRGDMAPIILAALLDKPMHGYEIISHLEERSQGMWRPSAGSIYPNLQMLEEQEMIKSEKIDGKKVYTLTDKGKEAAEEAKEHLKGRLRDVDASSETLRSVRLILHKIRHDLRAIGELKNEAKRDQAMTILEETESKLSKLIDKEE